MFDFEKIHTQITEFYRKNIGLSDIEEQYEEKNKPLSDNEENIILDNRERARDMNNT